MIKTQSTTPLHELGWYFNAELLENPYQWIVELHSFELTLPLAQDMKAQAVNSIVLELRFGKDFPNSPPFVRVIRPRFLPIMQGGGGHVTAGGAMCMELLTNNGWLPTSTIEAVLLQVRVAITTSHPNPSRLAVVRRGTLNEYSMGEAMEAYNRAARNHGVSPRLSTLD
jgi:ubiquitin-conjugating enzyme E2 Q